MIGDTDLKVAKLYGMLPATLQLTAKHKVATPVNWKQGDEVIIAGSVSDEEAKKTYPQGWTAPRPYLRVVPQRGA
jgi:alkyl hydroperoxide reductase subunit AhpC